MGSSRTTAVFATTGTAVGVAAAWVLLGERPRWPALAGGGVIVGGLAWLARARG
jgi:drug/metabolite transporter (DMT)-like permease